MSPATKIPCVYAAPQYRPQADFWAEPGIQNARLVYLVHLQDHSLSWEFEFTVKSHILVIKCVIFIFLIQVILGGLSVVQDWFPSATQCDNSTILIVQVDAMDNSVCGNKISVQSNVFLITEYCLEVMAGLIYINTSTKSSEKPWEFKAIGNEVFITIINDGY